MGQQPSSSTTRRRPRVRTPTLLGLLLCVALIPCVMGVWHCATGFWSVLHFWELVDLTPHVAPLRYRQYVRSASPSGESVAIVYCYDGPTEYDRSVVVQPRSGTFDPHCGIEVFAVTGPPFIDLQWTDEENLVVTCLGLREDSRGIYRQLSQASPGVSIEYRFIERTKDTLSAKAASPDDSYVAGVFEREYGFEPATITQLVVGKVISGSPGPVSRVISPNHDWVPITVGGSHRMPFHWAGPTTVVLDCTGIPKEDVCYAHAEFRGLTVEYVGLVGE